MPITAAPSEPGPSKRSPVTRVPDQVLARARKDLNKATARRIYADELPALLLKLEAAAVSKLEAEQLVALGEWGGIAQDGERLRQALATLRG